jgi:hypothetical protein
VYRETDLRTGSFQLLCLGSGSVEYSQSA